MVKFYRHLTGGRSPLGSAAIPVATAGPARRTGFWMYRRIANSRARLRRSTAAISPLHGSPSARSFPCAGRSRSCGHRPITSGPPLRIRYSVPPMGIPKRQQRPWPTNQGFRGSGVRRFPVLLPRFIHRGHWPDLNFQATSVSAEAVPNPGFPGARVTSSQDLERTVEVSLVPCPR